MTPPGPCDNAEPFHDILDGYFTLQESVRQMLERYDLTWAWLVLCHAPIMDIQGLAPDAPVPLHLRSGYGGVIDTLVLTATHDSTGETDGPTLIGTGTWRWLDGRADASLPSDVRLAEPAYVKGFALSDRPMPPRKRMSASALLQDFATLTAGKDQFQSFSA